jgi:glycosyltransferase involved in cell wall biosynthesis
VIVVHTQGNRDQLVRRGVADSCISVVPHGARELLTISEDRRRASRELLNLPNQTPTVLFLGNIRPYKGLSDLLRAFRTVASKVPAARLIIAGQPWLPRTEIEDEIASLGLADSVQARLEFVSQELMEAHLAAADVVVYPYTYFDAQSGAACDALRAGRAMIVTDVGGLPDLVADPIAIVPPNDPQSLASALERVLTDTSLRRKLEGQSRDKAASLTWPSIATQTVRVYQRMLDPHALQGEAPDRGTREPYLTTSSGE